MRKLLLLPIVMLNLAVWTGAEISPASAGQSDPISVIPGNWTLRYNFDCVGGTTPITAIFAENGTFSVPTQSLTGTWSFSGDTIRFTFGSNSTSYVGVEYNNSMKGRSAASDGSFYGCWTASKNGVSQLVKSKVSADGSKKSNKSNKSNKPNK